MYLIHWIHLVNKNICYSNTLIYVAFQIVMCKIIFQAHTKIIGKFMS